MSIIFNIISTYKYSYYSLIKINCIELFYYSLNLYKMLNEDWFCILDTILMSTCIILTCILFTLFLIFKPLRTHPGELLILAAFFQVSWMFSIVVQQTSCYNIQIHIFITFGKIFIGRYQVYFMIYIVIQSRMPFISESRILWQMEHFSMK